ICEAANSIFRVRRTMDVRLSCRFGSSYGVLPAFPLDSAIYMAPVGRPEHSYIQRHGGHVIKDEGERKMVTSQIKAVAGLAGNEKQDSQEKQKRILHPCDDQQKRNPREACLHLAKHSPWSAAHQAIEIFLPALPHLLKRAVHSYSNNAVAGAEPDAMARGLHAHGEGDVLQNLAGDTGMAADDVVHIAAHHHELTVCGSGG